NVVDLGRVDSGAGDQFAQAVREQVGGQRPVQGAGGLALADRGSDCSDDDGIPAGESSHGVQPPWAKYGLLYLDKRHGAEVNSMAVLQGVLADRDRWSPVGHCPIEKTMGLLGTKSAMLIMREAYYGTTRFDDFCQRVGITKAAASARLAELVDIGLLERRPYREPGQRTRDEYVLTEAGTAFMPVVWAMFEWGRRHLP